MMVLVISGTIALGILAGVGAGLALGKHSEAQAWKRAYEDRLRESRGGGPDAAPEPPPPARPALIQARRAPSTGAMLDD
jgi:hypothetical protein